MSITPAKIQPSQIPIFIKQKINHFTNQYNYHQPSPIRQIEHQSPPATKIQFHSPQANMNQYCNRLIPNIANDQQIKFIPIKRNQPILKIYNPQFNPNLLQKDLKLSSQINNKIGNSDKSIIKITSRGNQSSAATRSRGISQISVVKSQQHRSSLSQAYQLQYKMPLSPCKILKNVPVKRINNHIIQGQINNSQNFHITIESKEQKPLPAIITVTQTTPINSIASHLPPNNSFHIQTLDTNLLPTKLRHTNESIISHALSNNHNHKMLQVNNSEKIFTQTAKFRPDNGLQLKDNLSSFVQIKQKDHLLIQRSAKSRSLNKDSLSKIAYAQRFNIETNEKKNLHMALHLKTSLEREKGSDQIINQAKQINQNPFNKSYYDSEYQNHEYYNMQLQSGSSNMNELLNQQKCFEGYIYKQRLSRSSRRLINQIFENETNKALLSMQRIQIKSRQKSNHHKIRR